MNVPKAETPEGVLPRKTYVYLGSSGRIGTLLRAVWPTDTNAKIKLFWQFRDIVSAPQESFLWARTADPRPLCDLARRQGGLDGLFVFWGVSGRGDKNSETEMAANVTVVEDALFAAKAAGLDRVIVASSSSVYGASEATPYCETDTPKPLNAYGAAKLEMEKRCAEIADAEGLNVCCLRIGNVAGADALLQDRSRIQRPNSEIILDTFADGHGPSRSYIGPVTLARVLEGLALVDGPLPPILNVAAPQPVSMDALLTAAGLTWTARAAPPSALQNIALDVSRLHEIIPLLPEEALAQTIVAQWKRATRYL